MISHRPGGMFLNATAAAEPADEVVVGCRLIAGRR